MVSFSVGGLSINSGPRIGLLGRESLWDVARLLVGGYTGAAAATGRAPAFGGDTAFAAHFESHVRPHADRFEQSRIRSIGTFRRNLFLFVPFAVAVLAGLAYVVAMMPPTEDFPFGLLVGAAVLVSAGYYLARAPVRAYRSGVKSEIFPQIFSYFGTDFRFAESSPLSVEALEPSGLIPYYQKESTEDHVSGTYRGVALELMEAHLTKKTGSGKSRRTVTVFNGMFVRLSMNKAFSGKTLVKRDAGAVLNWMADRFDALERVRLEDPRFEDRFEVYSSDQIEARYLLTPAFMERLLSVAETFRSGTLQCSFYDDRLLVMIPTPKNRFEPGSIFAPATFVAEAETLLREMAEIFAIIDVLKLNERTGL